MKHGLQPMSHSPCLFYTVQGNSVNPPNLRRAHANLEASRHCTEDSCEEASGRREQHARARSVSPNADLQPIAQRPCSQYDSIQVRRNCHVNNTNSTRRLSCDGRLCLPGLDRLPTRTARPRPVRGPRACASACGRSRSGGIAGGRPAARAQTHARRVPRAAFHRIGFRARQTTMPPWCHWWTRCWTATSPMISRPVCYSCALNPT